MMSMQMPMFQIRDNMEDYPDTFEQFRELDRRQCGIFPKIRMKMRMSNIGCRSLKAVK